MAAKTLFFVFNSNKKLLKKAKCHMAGIDNESLEGDAGYFLKIGNALLWRMSLPRFFGVKNRRNVVENGGIEILLTLLSKLQNDGDVVNLVIELVAVLVKEGRDKETQRASIRVLNYAGGCGRQLVEDVLLAHQDDETIRSNVRIIVRALIQSGAVAALETMSLQRPDLTKNCEGLLPRHRLQWYRRKVRQAIELNITFHAVNALSSIACDDKTNLSYREEIVAPNKADAQEDVVPSPSERDDIFVRQDQKGMDAVLDAMNNYADNEEIQCNGLDIILLRCDTSRYEISNRCNNPSPVSFDKWTPFPFANPGHCAQAIVRAMEKTDEFGIVWRAYCAALEVAKSDERMPFELAKAGGCETIMEGFADLWQTVSSEPDGKKIALVEKGDICQTKLWLVAIMCREEYSRKRFEEAGLKSLMYNLLCETHGKETEKNRLSTVGERKSNECDDDTIVTMSTTEVFGAKTASYTSRDTVVVPLELRRLYTMKQLAEEHRFGGGVLKINSSENGGEGKGDKMCCVKPERTVKMALPLPKNSGPKYGTIDDIFHHGEPGLVSISSS